MMARTWALLNTSKKRMKSNLILLLITFFLFQSYISYPQKSKKSATVLFYNTENLFDARNDSESEDDEFTPDGDRHWTNKRLNQKLINISKVILNSSGFETPDVVALCEIENHYVLESLLSSTPLKNLNYKIIHKESPDHRGIDVALLYNAEFVYPLEYDFYPLYDKGFTVSTREILYFAGVLNETDTLHFFVNHWPSRYDGLLESEPLRNLAAQLLKSKVEELLLNYNAPKIIILGDFNDQPTDESISEILNAKEPVMNPDPYQLYNLSFSWMNDEIQTLKYQSQWSVFDQCIVSGNLLNHQSGYFINLENVQIVKLPFLLEKDDRYGGLKPFRTYNGFLYEGGFSDHMPVLLKLNLVD